MAPNTWFLNMVIANIYIVCKIGLKAKIYGIKDLVLNIINLVAQYMQLLY